MTVVAVSFVQQTLPAGKTFANVVITLTDSVGNAQTATIDGVTVTSATFDTSRSAPGTITAVANSMATDGTVLASASGSGVIPAPATFPSPSTVTVVVS